MVKLAHLIAGPGFDPKKHRAVFESPTVSMIIVASKDVDEAVNTAKRLVKEEGVQLIELCGAFGPVGTAKVIEAVGEEIPVASVGYGLDIAVKASALFE